MPPGSRVRMTGTPPAREVRLEARRLGRLAGALGPLDRDEPAAPTAATGRVTAASVAARAGRAAVDPVGRADRVPSASWDVIRHRPARRARAAVRTRPPLLAVWPGSAAAGRRRGPSARQLHDQPLRRASPSRRTRSALDVVIDMAEIPAFQERQHMDADGDGTVSDEEAARRRRRRLRALVGRSRARPSTGRPRRSRRTSAAISFPAGLGGLSTMRLECAFDAPLAAPLAGGRRRSPSRTSRTPSGSAGARSSRRATACRSTPAGCRRRACRSG